YLWKRYRRVAAIAAVIAIVTTVGVIAATNYFSPKADISKLQELDRKLMEVRRDVNTQNTAINDLKKKVVVPAIQFKAGGTGFVIDAKGWLVTSAHIIRNSKHIVVMNGKGEQFNARVAK